MAQPFLTPVLDGAEWSDLGNGCFTPGDRVPGTIRIGDEVDTRIFLDIREKITIYSPDFSAVQSLYQLSYLCYIY
jgi:hypothetical protein